MEQNNQQRDQWVSKLGLVLAMAGNAVGLGNFIRFPMQAAQNGGGAFMIPYFIALIFLGLPLMFIEWGMGRYGGSKGHATMPGILALVRNNKVFRWLGAIGVWIPLVIASYYTFIESWAMGYSIYSLMGTFGSSTKPGMVESFFSQYVGIANFWPLAFFLITIVINGFILYQGISHGIEKAAKILMPLLFIFAIVLVVRVVTLGAPLEKHPDWNVNKGFGFVWNPKFSNSARMEWDDIKDPETFLAILKSPRQPLDKYIFSNLSPRTRSLLTAHTPGEVPDQQLKEAVLSDINNLISRKSIYSPELFKGVNIPKKIKEKIGKQLTGEELIRFNRSLLKAAYPDIIAAFQKLNIFGIWLAAAGQIFFTLSLGMGAIACYASYVKKDDDVVASGLATALTNETTEVVLGGSIAIPLAVAFFGLGAAREIASSAGLGFAFTTMPLMFGKIPLGALFGAVWFLLLFFAGITSSIAMGQIVVAFLEEIVGFSRHKSVIITMATIFILSQLAIFGFNYGAMDEMDTMAGTMGLPLFALVEVIVWVHIFGIDKSWKELMQGSKINLWQGIKWITAYVTPVFLIIIIGGWIYSDGWNWLTMQNVAEKNHFFLWITRGVLLAVFLAIGWLATHNMHRTENREEEETEVKPA